MLGILRSILSYKIINNRTVRVELINSYIQWNSTSLWNTKISL